MNLAKINFNLLLSLDALLTERHVTLAGERLGLSQSTMSVALKQLRSIFDDELLVRGQSSQMILTPLAESLVVPVREALQGIDRVFSGHKEFVPAEAETSFVIGMSDYSGMLLPRLIQIINREAPKLYLNVKHVNQLNSLHPFESGELDLAIGRFEYAPETLVTQKLFDEHVVAVASDKHPAFQTSGPIDAKILATYPLAEISSRKTQANSPVQKLREMGLRPKIAITLPHAAAGLTILPGTELINLAAKRIALAAANKLGLKIKELPFAQPSYSVKQFWHQRSSDDPAHRWVRSLIKDISAGM